MRKFVGTVLDAFLYPCGGGGVQGLGCGGARGVGDFWTVFAAFL